MNDETPPSGICVSEPSDRDGGIRQLADEKFSAENYLFPTYRYPKVGGLGIQRNLKMIFAFMGVIALEVAVFFFPLTALHEIKITQTSWPAIHEHDQRMAHYRETILSYDPATTAIVVLQGQFYNKQKKVAVYPYNDIRVLAALFPQYTLTDFLGAKNLYSTVHNFTTIYHSEHTIILPRVTQRLLILADYLHPDVLPQPGPKLIATSQDESPFNGYHADISNIDRFQFLGFEFSRER